MFDEHCNSIVFQTNINNHDDVDSLLNDIAQGAFVNKFTKALESKFNECFPSDVLPKGLSKLEIRKRLAKLRFETDVQFLKNGDNDFEPKAREQIYQYSEIDLSYIESKEIIHKLLQLVENKSSGCLLYTSPSPRDQRGSRMPSSA